MKKILSLLIVLMGIFVLTGCRFSPKKVNINIPIDEKEYTKEELTNGITHEEFKALSGDFIVVAKNTNSVVVDLTFEVEYYDENNSLIKSGKTYLTAVSPSSEVAVEIFDVPESYSSYKAYVDAEQSNYAKSYTDQLEVSDRMTDEVVAQVKNNSNETIDFMETAVIFYKGDEVAGFDDAIATEIKPGRYGNFSFYNPYDKNYADIEFDSYKVYVNSAYSYNYN